MDQDLPHAALLAELQRVRSTLALRKRALERSWQQHQDPMLVNELREQVNELDDLCMALGQLLWTAISRDREAQAASPARGAAEAVTG